MNTKERCNKCGKTVEISGFSIVPGEKFMCEECSFDPEKLRLNKHIRQLKTQINVMAEQTIKDAERIEILETQLKRMKEQEAVLINTNKMLIRQLDCDVEESARYKEAMNKLKAEQFKGYQQKLKTEVDCEYKIQEAVRELNLIKKFVSQLDIDDKLAEFINNEWYNED